MHLHWLSVVQKVMQNRSRERTVTVQPRCTLYTTPQHFGWRGTGHAHVPSSQHSKCGAAVCVRVCCNGVCTCCLWKHALLQLQPGTGRLCLSCNCSSATQPCLCFNTRRTRLLAHTALLQANHVHTLHTNAHTESICCSSRSATMTWGSWPTATAERHWQPLGCPASAQTNARDKGHYRYTCS